MSPDGNIDYNICQSLQGEIEAKYSDQTREEKRNGKYKMENSFAYFDNFEAVKNDLLLVLKSFSVRIQKALAR